MSILDLHWIDDDHEQQAMATKVPASTSAVSFWDSVASTFSNNSLVFFELYNEPHVRLEWSGRYPSIAKEFETYAAVHLDQADVGAWMDGDDGTSAGMLEMLAAVRAHAPGAPVIIAGSAAYAWVLIACPNSVPRDFELNPNHRFIYHPLQTPFL